jgi:hypothetical protein
MKCNGRWLALHSDGRWYGVAPRDLDCPNGVKGIQPRVTGLAKRLCEEVPGDVMNSEASPTGVGLVLCMR